MTDRDIEFIPTDDAVEEQAEEEFATEEHEEALDEIVQRHYGLDVAHDEEQP